MAAKWEYPDTRVMNTRRLDRHRLDFVAAFGEPGVDVRQNRQLSRQEVEVESAHLEEEFAFAGRAYVPMLRDPDINVEMLENYGHPRP